MRNVQPAAPAKREGRLAALDGLRLVAALLVVSYHYVGTARSDLWERPNNEIFTHLYGVAVYGSFGVQLFFIVSGFVICMSSWGRRLSDFLISRIVRLYPMYWVAVALTFTVVYLNRPTADDVHVIFRVHSLSDLLLNFTMAQEAFGVPHIDWVYWTLWAELKFYLLFAIVVALGVTYRRVLTFCALWMAAAVLFGSLNIPIVNTVVQPAYAPYFVAGILLYCVHRFGSTWLLWGMIAGCLLVAQHQLLVDVRWNSAYVGHSLKWVYAEFLVLAFFGCVAAVALGWTSWARWRWLTVAGALTYPLYLLHQDIGVIFIRSMQGEIAPWPLLAITVGGMLLLAYLSHRLVEVPFAPLMKKALRRSFDAVGRADGQREPKADPPVVDRSAGQRADVPDPDVVDLLGRAEQRV
ncbi:acyltransferase family protein [Dactylosporangium matsuzakiense]|uniref:Acyltransferase n=1 Tax=Dactylosporangium matsuzakiense TaxID=53360 RepID=A0A9W6KEY9_9ACTN|nr:acyltransferase [Dactylosporangium matsuzakiense]UWZ45686.1 acyltransferase [Dactylosporangium matsuzakiense]GLL00293.1 acyltransferase [Dactylosporangium matsuzakiense]